MENHLLNVLIMTVPNYFFQGSVEIARLLQTPYAYKTHWLKENRRDQERNCHCALDKQTFARNPYIDHQY